MRRSQGVFRIPKESDKSIVPSTIANARIFIFHRMQTAISTWHTSFAHLQKQSTDTDTIGSFVLFWYLPGTRSIFIYITCLYAAPKAATSTSPIPIPLNTRIVLSQDEHHPSQADAVGAGSHSRQVSQSTFCRTSSRKYELSYGVVLTVLQSRTV